MKKKVIVIAIIIVIIITTIFCGITYTQVKAARKEAAIARDAQFKSLEKCYELALEQADYTIPVETGTSNRELIEKYGAAIKDKSLSDDKIDTFVSETISVANDYKNASLWVNAYAENLKKIDTKVDEDTQKNLDLCWYSYNTADGNMKTAYEALTNIEKLYTEYNAKVEEQKKAAAEAAKKNAVQRESSAPVDPTDSVYLNVANIEQNPELPTGCEAVSATIVLNYYGAGMSKTELVDNYLPYSDSPYSGFVGSPYEQPNGHGHWCAAGPIEVAMNNAIAAHGLGLTVNNISGSSFDTVLSYVKSGHPVVFWGYENMSSGFHTLALIGYDRGANVCYFADPLKSGIQTYDLDATRRSYNGRGKQAIIVQ